ncbi:MAG: hypothetical protein Q8N23_22380 [Archangium sp.]|nr:hypothetical protein [Archangium sp.]MDP3155438.1 hypothetical protein [Archangium sp.]MDP3573770.1 hypothetical protein [Archangium sp.]
MTEPDARWGHLVNAAFHLDELKSPDAASAVVALDSVLEAFDVEVDPVDDFRSYAVRRFALSLRRALSPSPCGRGAG